jgi:large subunit ribosomal protein L4
MLKIIDFKLPKETFEAKVNIKLLAQANHILVDRAHTGLRNTKTRSEVNRTTKKIYKQKGTGGARHGSRRANLYVGGGIIFGPRPLHRIRILPQAIKNAAKIAAFSLKNKEKQVFVVSGISKLAKTKEVSEFLKTLKSKRFTFLISEKSISVLKFLRNVENVKAVFYPKASALDIFNGGTIVIDEDVFETKKEVKEAK